MTNLGKKTMNKILGENGIQIEFGKDSMSAHYNGSNLPVSNWQTEVHPMAKHMNASFITMSIELVIPSDVYIEMMKGKK